MWSSQLGNAAQEVEFEGLGWAVFCKHVVVIPQPPVEVVRVIENGVLPYFCLQFYGQAGKAMKGLAGHGGR